MKGSQKFNNRKLSFKTKSKPLVSIIIPVLNEEKRIASVIRESKQISSNSEIIVIANGCTDRTVPIAKKMGAKVIEFPEAMGHDVGRAIGAYHARGSILLFLDGDMVIPASNLQPFIQKIKQGYDIALNSYPKSYKRYPPHPTVTAKHTLNIILGRNDLRAASLTSVPFAMKKTAAETIGYANLSVPPLAQAIAIHKGLRVVFGGYVNVGKLNLLRNRKRNANKRNPICDLILGDHLEAIGYLIYKRGVRGGFDDLSRMRQKISDIQKQVSNNELNIQWNQSESGTGSETESESDANNQTSKITTIIPACNESSTIASAIKTARKTGIDRILVVDNGSNDNTATYATVQGAQVYQCSERLGHDIGRAIGAIVSDESNLLFMDGDMTIPSKDLAYFVDSVQNGIDVALNNLNQLLPKKQQFDNVSVLKRFLNLIMNKQSLGICSLTAVPHALSERAIREIGPENLAIPPLAHVIALQKNLNVKAVHGVDVIKRNKVRPNLHLSASKPLQKLIIGDHIEAIAYLLSTVGIRAYFPDTNRKRSFVAEYVKSEIKTDSIQLSMKKYQLQPI